MRAGYNFRSVTQSEYAAMAGMAIHFDQAAKVLSGDKTSTRIISYPRPKY